LGVLLARIFIGNLDGKNAIILLAVSKESHADNLHINQQRQLQEHFDGPQELYEFSANAFSCERKGMIIGFFNNRRIPLT
jgi:hypothetical protein